MRGGDEEMQQSTIPKEGILTGILSLGMNQKKTSTMVKFSVSEQGVDEAEGNPRAGKALRVC